MKGSCKVVEQYLKKGAKVYLEGQLQTRKYTDKEGVEKYSTEVVLQGFNSMLTMLDGARRRRRRRGFRFGRRFGFRFVEPGAARAPTGDCRRGRASATWTTTFRSRVFPVRLTWCILRSDSPFAGMSGG